MPGTSARPCGSSKVIRTGMTCVTFWKLPEEFDCGKAEKTPAEKTPGENTPDQKTPDTLLEGSDR